jgi:plastocyanin
MKKGLLVAGIVVVILAVAGVAVARKSNHTTTAPTANSSDKTTPSSSNTSATNSSTQQSTTGSSTTGQTATITYSDSGFSPATITVKAGTTVTVKNTSSHAVQFDSDPHPSHTDDTDLNAGLIQAGASQSFMVDKKGNYGYHNHLNESETGSIVVQ